MNWKRGLARIYIVVWILFSIAGAWFAVVSTRGDFDNRRALLKFLADNKGLVTLEDVRTLPADTLLYRVRDRLIRHDGTLQHFPRNATDDEIRNALKIAPGESLSFVPTFDAQAAGEVGYSVEEMAQHIKEAVDAGRDLRVFPISDDLELALMGKGIRGERLDRLRVGTVSDLELSQHKDAAESGIVQHPLLTITKIAGIWAACCLIGPGVILLTLRWIVTGFSK